MLRILNQVAKKLRRTPIKYFSINDPNKNPDNKKFDEFNQPNSKRSTPTHNNNN